MLEDRERDSEEDVIDPPDNQKREEVSLDSSGDEAKAIDPPDNQ
jgi:hypothetical protein